MLRKYGIVEAQILGWDYLEYDNVVVATEAAFAGTHA